jgi:hypothetical protein
MTNSKEINDAVLKKSNEIDIVKDKIVQQKIPKEKLKINKKKKKRKKCQ